MKNRKKYVKRDASERTAIVRAIANDDSGDSIEAKCRKHGIAGTQYWTWLKKYGEPKIVKGRIEPLKAPPVSERVEKAVAQVKQQMERAIGIPQSNIQITGEVLKTMRLIARDEFRKLIREAFNAD